MGKQDKRPKGTDMPIYLVLAQHGCGCSSCYYPVAAYQTEQEAEEKVIELASKGNIAEYRRFEV